MLWNVTLDSGISLSLSLSQSHRACPQVRPLVSSPFNRTNVRGKHKSMGMGNKFRETTYTMGMSIQGSSLPCSGETMAGLG